MTEIPEHLLKRAAERRAALQAKDAEEPTEPGAGGGGEAGGGAAGGGAKPGFDIPSPGFESPSPGFDWPRRFCGRAAWPP